MLAEKGIRLKIKGLESLPTKGLVFNTKGPEETKRVGFLIGELLEAGDVVALDGDLGSGKTCLIQGIARGVGVKERYITSPTFIMINEYIGRIPFYHIDLYRVGLSGLEGLGLREYIFSDGVTVIEWAEKAGDELPEERISVYLRIMGRRSREIRLIAWGERYIRIIKGLTKGIPKIQIDITSL